MTVYRKEITKNIAPIAASQNKAFILAYSFQSYRMAG